MTKKEFVEQYATKTGLNKKEAADQIEGFLATVEDALSKGEKIPFIGWGTFEVKQTKERLGRNPKTGEEVMIPSRKVVKFKAGKKLAEKVDN